MKRHEISYFFREGIRGIFLHGFSNFVAVGVIVACLLIMGSFTLVAFNIDRAIVGVQNSNEILIYVDETMSASEAEYKVGSRINQNDNVARSDFIDKDKALAEFGEKMDPAYRDLLAGMEKDNSLRHRYRVLLRDISQLSETIVQLEAIPGVAKVAVRQDIVESLGSVRRVVNSICLILILALLCVSLFIIAKTVKLATFDRREEIGIMRIVGATKGFVRLPFVIEGFLLGLIAAVIALFLQWSIYSFLSDRVSEGLSGITQIQTVPFSDMTLPVLLIFVLTGFLVGMGGSLITIRKFLKV